MINSPNIRTQFSALREDYENVQPFAHIARNNVFDPDTLRNINTEFPPTDRMGGSFTGEIQGGKFAESDWEKFGPTTQDIVSVCNSGPFLKALEELTGIPGLIADPYLSDGGQHQSGQGAKLKVHSDFNVHLFFSLHTTNQHVGLSMKIGIPVGDVSLNSGIKT